MTLTRSDLISQRLAACLVEAGYACEDCKGYGMVTPQRADELRGASTDAYEPIEGCDVCADPSCYRNAQVAFVTCPSCHGTRLNPEEREHDRLQEAKMHDPNVCPVHGEVMEEGDHGPICRTCANEARCDFPYVEPR